ncbi:MAG: hypothetical protein AB7U85_10245 [Alphaproteobacteria bacterium]
MPTRIETNYFELAFYIIGSFGGAGAIILAVSSWLGKIWANRVMEKDRANYSKELEKLRAELEKSNNKEIEEIKNELSIYKEQYLKGFNDKINIYRMVVDIVSEALGEFNAAELTKIPLNIKTLNQIDRLRIKAYGYLAMMAPQNVMDKQDVLMDYLLNVAYSNEKYDWKRTRAYSLDLLNEIRKDLKFDENPITYNGKL